LRKGTWFVCTTLAAGSTSMRRVRGRCIEFVEREEAFTTLTVLF
jgi:hypothetical protein